MDNVLLRFPHLGEQIFENLADESLANCHQLTRTCWLFIEDHKSFWIRVIKKLLDHPRFGANDRNIMINKILLKFNSDSVELLELRSKNFA